MSSDNISTLCCKQEDVAIAIGIIFSCKLQFTGKCNVIVGHCRMLICYCLLTQCHEQEGGCISGGREEEEQN